MHAADQFHTGIVVDDLEATLSDLASMFGHQWCQIFDAPVQVRVPEGEIDLPLRFCYSMTEPRLEIIASVPGTLWTPAAGSGIHHMGFWSDDVPADSARLTDQGYAWEASGLLPDGTAYWAYHRHPHGPRIELVSRQLQAGMEQYWRTGQF